MDGSNGCTDLRMSIPDNSACFVRNTAKRDGSLLLIGELAPPHFRPLHWAEELLCRVWIALRLGTDCEQGAEAVHTAWELDVRSAALMATYAGRWHAAWLIMVLFWHPTPLLQGITQAELHALPCLQVLTNPC